MNTPHDHSPRPSVIAVSDVWFAYPGAPAVLKGVSLTVHAGAICMLLGPSGSGKSTLLKLIKGLLRPQRGWVSVFGVDVSRGWSRHNRCTVGCRVAYIPQHLGLVKNLTVMDNVLMGALGRTGTLASLVKAFAPDDLHEAAHLLEQLGICHKADEKVHSLSGGEQQRVAIARAFMQHPQLVLADEFVSHLDPVTTRDIMILVRQAARAGVTFVITSHEVEVVAEYGEHAVFLRRGEKAYEGPARAVTSATARRVMEAL